MIIGGQTYIDSKLRVPDIRLRDVMVSGQFVLVLEVSVLDMLGQPVLGKVHVLGGDRVGHPGQGLEENIMLLLVVSSAAFLSALHVLLLLVVKVVSEQISVDVQDVDAVGIIGELLHHLEKLDVLLVQSVVVDLEGLVPDIGISNMEWHLALVSEVSVLDVLGEPVLGVVEPLGRHWAGDASHGGEEGIVLVDVLVSLLGGIGGGLQEKLLLVDKMLLVACKTGA